MRIFKTFAFLLLCLTHFQAQTLLNFNKERQQIDQQLMIGLGTWAASNFALSGYGWATTASTQEKYFHQMNVMWNTVNLGLAVPGYFRAKNANSALNNAQTWEAQQKTQRIFLINSALDLGYMASGFVLKQQNSTNPSKQAQFQGYGNSLLLQGGFLLLFDLSAYWIHQHHGSISQEKGSFQLQPSSNGIGLRLQF
ncbi:MAG: hypothetical protein RIR94_1524 [Bacteroidota bacterium]|jgi:hypothetical protein